MASAILLAHGPLKQGLSATLTGFVYRNGGRIVGHDQYVDPELRRYYVRLAWDLDGFAVGRDAMPAAVEETTRSLGLEGHLSFSDTPARVAVFVSSLSHCLYDIVGRWRSGEWDIEIPLIVSNHDALAEVARRFDIPFHHFAMTSETHAAQERKQIALLREQRIDLVVLARYMQMLGPELIAAFPSRIINIHHAFLPSFPGAKPYHAAYRRGVKMIGATSHYVTTDLDAGPIIDQDVIRVTHADDVDELVRRGRDVEKIVLARAIFAHLQRKVIVDAGRTIVFA